MEDFIFASHANGLKRGAEAMRAGYYDETISDWQKRQTAAHAYLRKKGVLEWSYDYDYANVMVWRVFSSKETK